MAFLRLPGVLGSRQQQGPGQLARVQASALAPQSMPNFSLHNVRYVGEAVGETPKLRQIRVASAVQLPPTTDTAACDEMDAAVGGMQLGLPVAGMTEKPQEHKAAVVKVVGVGYGGSKAVQAMLQKPGLEAAEFFLVAADSESTLDPTPSLPETNQIVVGLDKLYGGQVKSQAEMEDDLEARLEGADLVVVVAGERWFSSLGWF